MASNNETVEDIAREMRSVEFDDPGLDVRSLVAIYTLARGWADRIEAAVKREREITREKSSQVGNARNCDRPECATTKAAQEVWRKEDGGKTAYYEWLLAASTKGEAK